ncbi:DRC3 protein, partial [Serilophus lunatus]|nr:DRC3 protein [Serilophus lunatus]
MSQFYKNVEPNVIDDEMVQNVIEEKCPDDLGNLIKGENIDFKDVTELQLSFKSILQIDNLWYLENLTKLQLDNNFIEKIEALESLVHLVWLDLSFNNIEVIEGLDTLVKLQDLSLYSNRISKIENMDTLQDLQIFSIGKNNLASLENVVYLRRFKNLQTLNLSGNPFCDGEQYMLFVVAHLPKLVYLDFKLVRDTTVRFLHSLLGEIRQQHLTEPLLGWLASNILVLGAGSLQKSGSQNTHTFVEHLNGSSLFDSLYAEDTEAAKLASLPGVEDLLQAYPSNEFVSVCRNLHKYGLKEYEKRETEVSDFYKRLHEVLIAGQEENRKVVLDFENRNNEKLDEIRRARSDDIAESKRAECKEDILQLWDVLMTLETLVCNELEQLLKDFKRSIDVIASTLIENIKEIYPFHMVWSPFSLTIFCTMAQCRDLENHHHEKVMEIALTTMEKRLMGELEENLPDDVQMLLLDKDTLVNTINTSHGVRLQKIDKRESDMLCNTYHW